jgi:acyl dehydratase
MTGLYFDEFKVGDVFRSPGMTVSESEILDFAMRYDPRPYHIDVVAAEATEFGGLIASGFHTLALSFSLLVRSGFLEAANLGSPGLDEVRWDDHSPRQRGDAASAVALETRPGHRLHTPHHDRPE